MNMSGRPSLLFQGVSRVPKEMVPTAQLLLPRLKCPARLGFLFSFRWETTRQASRFVTSSISTIFGEIY